MGEEEGEKDIMKLWSAVMLDQGVVAILGITVFHLLGVLHATEFNNLGTCMERNQWGREEDLCKRLMQHNDRGH